MENHCWKRVVTLLMGELTHAEWQLHTSSLVEVYLTMAVDRADIDHSLSSLDLDLDLDAVEDNSTATWTSSEPMTDRQDTEAAHSTHRPRDHLHTRTHTHTHTRTHIRTRHHHERLDYCHCRQTAVACENTPRQIQCQRRPGTAVDLDVDLVDQANVKSSQSIRQLEVDFLQLCRCC